MPEATERLSAALADRYRILSRLGEGGMATVYLAEDVKHDRKVALKVLKPELAAVLGAERFVQEIKTTAALQHPHILPLFDSGRASGQAGERSSEFLYYVMPYIEGETLRQKLDRETQLSIEEAVRITAEVADALHYAHQQGIIHRDIKPENILLANGRPMVADFGIALAVSAAAGGRMTETGLSLGTPHYMSPEQATADKDLTAKSDIYSLGSVLYEMLTGNPPHTGSSAQQIIMKIVTDEARPITELRKSVPPNVAAATAKALEKLPADRFENAKDFARALSDNTFAFGTTGLVPSTGAPKHRSNILAVVGLAVAALAIVFAAWGWLRDTSPEAQTDAWTWSLNAPDSIEFTGAYTSASISPDGSVVVFGAVGPNGPRLWMRHASEENVVEVPGTRDLVSDSPAVSPDGSRVAFLSPGAVQVVSLTGGSATRIAQTDISSLVEWDGDEHVIFSTSSGLWRVGIEGGEPEQLTVAEGEYHALPSLLPEGKGLVYITLPTLFTGDGSDNKVVVVGPEGDDPTELVAGFMARYVDPGYLVVLSFDGSIKAYPFDVNRRAITGSATTIVSGIHAEMFSFLGFFSISETGRLVYVAGDDPDQEIVALDGQGRVVESGMGRVESYGPLVFTSADGRKLAFGSVARGRLTVRDLQTQSIVSLDLGPGLMDADFLPGGDSLVFARATTGIIRTAARPGAEQEVLAGTRDGIAFVSRGGVSRDGSTAYYSAYSGNDWVVRAVSATAGAGDDRLIFGDGSFSVFEPNPSPDGRWLAYVSVESGRTEVVVRSTDETRSEFWNVSSGGGFAPRWSEDGSRLYYLAPDSMMSVTIGTGPQWNAGTPQALFSIEGFSEGAARINSPYAVGADGKFYMFRESLTDSSTVRIVMIDDWRAALP